jgi:hypothetical protein
MGYRSDVTAVFYVSKEEHFPMLKLWLTENFPMDMFHDNTRWFAKGMVLEEKGTKWYDAYDEVRAFDKAVKAYEELVKEFDDSEVEGQPKFCYEFVRIGEDLDDIDAIESGHFNEGLIGVDRTITIAIEV